MMNIDVTFPGGKRVAAQVGAHRIETDQPRELGGEDSAPAPFDLFLASLATCAGVYALGFLQARQLSTSGLALRQEVEFDPASHLPSKIRLAVALPHGLPEKYRPALLRAVESCKVKKTFAAVPAFEVTAEPAREYASGRAA